MREKERFESLFMPEPNSGCWLWLGTLKHKRMGYGGFCYQGYPTFAHRAAYMIYKGSIPKGKLVMHSCDNGGCVNPDHLTLGTASDNSADMLMRDRPHGPIVPAKGSRNGWAKLTEKHVREIMASKKTRAELASRYNVRPATIKNIRTGRTWSWLSQVAPGGGM